MFQYNFFSQPEQKILDIFYGLIIKKSTILFRTAIAIALLGIVSCRTEIKLESSTATQTQNKSRINSSVSDAENMTSISDYQKITLVKNLEHPWSIAWLPDGKILITERPGRLRIFRDGILEPTPISGVPQVFAFGQGGLLDVSAHPRFAENRFIYLTYSHGDRSNNRTRIARARLENNTLGDLKVIFEVSQTKPGAQHFGSRIIWLPDGTLVASIGDGGNPPIEFNGEFIRQQAQNRNSHFGKVIRLNDDGSIPSNNPFATSTDAKPALWSYGHRNIQGITLDPTKNRVWATEHGSRGGDELNLIERGENYGWPVVTHSREYSGGLISPETSRPGLVDPKVIWTPSIAPSGLAFYNGDRFPQWRGNLFAGGLVSQDIRRIQLDPGGNVIAQNSIPIGQRVRDVRQGPDGLLYVLTDDRNGQLIRLEPMGK
ncbi:MAG: PQQ-dependent sugar dehydrogenase [Trichodesmium sp. St16_bin4-tuft]|uniref:Glucose sorbosone dehydrogenase n=1 Tax=Trichodesmium erythraeum (strain IMS101) TaxID=203124 RepID=Q10WC9_TRIEI|nr:PQQ-dependent sugar dehydrogenase [Trichodesmium erythraeum GBRTRLIN201]MDE5090258.1 PQQ-dependent sugar dehydrogenase [Trichodesmium sp. St18_bin3_1_1]MDE5099261.1 PQQ-dependent sugar dehydrogenase [Trichodesmium sp. St16_bin4-tuft]